MSMAIKFWQGQISIDVSVQFLHDAISPISCQCRIGFLKAYAQIVCTPFWHDNPHNNGVYKLVRLWKVKSKLLGKIKPIFLLVLGVRSPASKLIGLTSQVYFSFFGLTLFILLSYPKQGRNKKTSFQRNFFLLGSHI